MNTVASEFFVGVDGGGTSCRARLTDSQGKVLAEAKAGPANVYQNAPGSLNSIINAINDCLAQAGLSETDYGRLHVGMGLAGAEITVAHQFLSDWQHPFKTLVFQNDAHTACLGAHQGANGAMLIVGTGIKGWLIRDQHLWSCTGWGFPLADQGGGAWLGLRLLQETLDACDGLRPHSPATEEVLTKFAGDPSNISVWAATAKSGDYGQFAPLVVYGQPKGDAVAKQIMAEQAAIVSRILDRMLAQEPGNIALLGGLIPFVTSNLPQHYHQWLVEPQGDAMDGALQMIRQAVGA